MPSLIPKLLSSRGKEERLKRQDSKDDVRHPFRSARRDSKEEAKPAPLVAPSSADKDEAAKPGLRIFRRDNSREDVGVDVSSNSSGSAKGRQQDKTEDRAGVGGGATRSRGEQKEIGERSSRTSRCGENGKDNAVEGSSSPRSEAPIVPFDEAADSDEIRDSARMIDVIVAENRTQEERRVQDKMVVGELIDEKHLLAREPTVEAAENDKRDDDETRDITTDRLLDCSDSDVTGASGERKGLLEIGYGKKLDEFQVVSGIWVMVECRRCACACVCVAPASFTKLVHSIKLYVLRSN